MEWNAESADSKNYILLRDNRLPYACAEVGDLTDAQGQIFIEDIHKSQVIRGTNSLTVPLSWLIDRLLQIKDHPTENKTDKSTKPDILTWLHDSINTLPGVPSDRTTMFTRLNLFLEDQIQRLTAPKRDAATETLRKALSMCVRIANRVRTASGSGKLNIKNKYEPKRNPASREKRMKKAIAEFYTRRLNGEKVRQNAMARKHGFEKEPTILSKDAAQYYIEQIDEMIVKTETKKDMTRLVP